MERCTIKAGSHPKGRSEAQEARSALTAGRSIVLRTSRHAARAWTNAADQAEGAGHTAE